MFKWRLWYNPICKQESSRYRERFSFLMQIVVRNLPDLPLVQEKRMRFKMSCFYPILLFYTIINIFRFQCAKVRRIFGMAKIISSAWGIRRRKAITIVRKMLLYVSQQFLCRHHNLVKVKPTLTKFFR